MPRLRRPQLRDRHRTVAALVDDEPCLVWLADPDCPLLLHDFADAVALATSMLDSPVEQEALVLLDERRAVTAIVFDPPPAVGLYPGLTDGPGFEVPFCATLVITPVSTVRSALPTTAERQGFLALRRLHAVQGLALLDVIQVDFERAQSVAVSCDPDCVWFEQFEPFQFESFQFEPVHHETTESAEQVS